MSSETSIRRRENKNQQLLKALRICWLSLFFLVSACVPVKDMVYLQGNDNDGRDVAFSYGNTSYKLQKGDILDVRIISLDPQLNDVFNASDAGAIQLAQASAQTGGDIFYVNGYSIDEIGGVDLPFVGRIQVEGLDLSQAYDAIDYKVAALFSNYHLQVKIGGVRFSGLGEFNRPGKHVIMQNQVTIFEAIALCGDLTAVANRENIRLIRQYPDGTKIHTVNLLDQSVVTSAFYFLQPNDVIYVEPLPQRAWGAGVTGAQTLSTISTLATTLVLFLSLNL